MTRFTAALRVLPLLSLACLAAWRPSPAAGQGVWDLMPYRVRLAIAYEDAPAFTPAFRGDFEIALVRRAKQIYGSMWDVSVAPATAALGRAAIVEPLAVPFADVPADWLKFDLTYLDLGRSGQSVTEAVETDKAFVVYVSAAPGGYRAQARELDVPTQAWSAPREESVEQREMLADAAARAVSAAFAPLALIEEQQDKQATLRLRAGGLSPRDPTVAPVAPLGVFRPLLRFTDREGATVRVQNIDWTMLSVGSVDGALVQCTVISAMRNPLGGRTRGRTQRLALMVVPPEGETVLRLSTRGASTRPLSGYDVYSHPPGVETTLLIGRTDFRGELRIAPSPDNLLRVLLVKSGSEVLARLPMVPGLQPELSAALIDDDPRLAVEGFIVGLQEELIDAVARREVLLRQADQELTAGKLVEADATLAGIRALGSRNQYLAILSERRKTVTTVDAAIRKKVDKLFQDTRTVIVKYLDPQRLDELTARLVAARGASGGA